MKQQCIARLLSGLSLTLALAGMAGVALAGDPPNSYSHQSAPTAHAAAARAAAQMRAVAGRAHGAMTSAAARASAQILQLRRSNASAEDVAATQDAAIESIDAIADAALAEIEQISTDADQRIDDLNGTSGDHTIVNNAATAATARVNARNEWADDRVDLAVTRALPHH